MIHLDPVIYGSLHLLLIDVICHLIFVLFKLWIWQPNQLKQILSLYRTSILKADFGRKFLSICYYWSKILLRCEKWYIYVVASHIPVF